MEWTASDVEGLILYEDNHLLGINKPAGLLSQPDETGDVTLPDLIKDFIKERDQKPGNVFLGTVHRLDRPTSGAMVFAKTSKALRRMNELFKNRQVKKTYWLLTEEVLPEFEGVMEHWMYKDTEKKKVKVKRKPFSGAKKAVLKYKLLGRISSYYLWEVQLETGRSHQIRAQFAYEGAPVVGDRRYGDPRKKADRLYLHCAALEFVHPVRKVPIRIQAPLPPEGRWELFLDFLAEGRST